MIIKAIVILFAIVIEGCMTHDYQLHESSSSTLVCVLFCAQTETRVKDVRKGGRIKDDENLGTD